MTRWVRVLRVQKDRGGVPIERFKKELEEWEEACSRLEVVEKMELPEGLKRTVLESLLDQKLLATMDMNIASFKKFAELRSHLLQYQ